MLESQNGLNTWYSNSEAIKEFPIFPNFIDKSIENQLLYFEVCFVEEIVYTYISPWAAQ